MSKFDDGCYSGLQFLRAAGHSVSNAEVYQMVDNNSSDIANDDAIAGDQHSSDKCSALLYERLWSFSFHPLSFRSSFSGPAFFSPVKWSSIFPVLQFPVLHFPVFRIGPPFSTRTFRPFVLFGPPNSGPAFSVDPNLLPSLPKTRGIVDSCSAAFLRIPPTSLSLSSSDIRQKHTTSIDRLIFHTS